MSTPIGRGGAFDQCESTVDETPDGDAGRSLGETPECAT